MGDCHIPALFPAVKSDSCHRVDVRGSAEFVMADYTRLEENADKACLTESGVHSELFQNSCQFTRQLRRDEPVSGGRIDAIGPSRWHRHARST